MGGRKSKKAAAPRPKYTNQVVIEWRTGSGIIRRTVDRKAAFRSHPFDISQPRGASAAFLHCNDRFYGEIDRYIRNCEEAIVRRRIEERTRRKGA